MCGVFERSLIAVAIGSVEQQSRCVSRRHARRAGEVALSTTHFLLSLVFVSSQLVFKAINVILSVRSSTSADFMHSLDDYLMTETLDLDRRTTQIFLQAVAGLTASIQIIIIFIM